MILNCIAIFIFIIGLILVLLGGILKKKRALIIGICILLLLVISAFCVYIYKLEKNNEELELQNIGVLEDNTKLPIPDRIIYKDSNNKYAIINLETNQFVKIYSEIYNRMDNTIEGKVLKDSEIEQMGNEGSFIEFDYNTKSKNYIFMLDEKDSGIIKRLTEGGRTDYSNIII